MASVKPTIPQARGTDAEQRAAAEDGGEAAEPHPASASAASYEDMRACTDPLLAPALKEALDVMESTFRLYPASCIWQSWNGAFANKIPRYTAP